MKYYLIAGEASGDLHAAHLMKQICLIDNQAVFRFRGGDKMLEISPNIHKHYAEFSIMGFFNVIRKLKAIFKDIKECKEDIRKFSPDIIILVDFPGYNLRIAKWAKQQQLKVAYYILPKVWAWNEKRVKALKENTGLRLSILPFEEEYFKTKDVEVKYVGNPLRNYILHHKTNANFLKKNSLQNKPIISILPGSRKQELQFILPTIIKAISELSDFQCVIIGAPNLDLEQYTQIIHGQYPVVFNQNYDALQHSTVAIVASGTATLETALCKTPQIVVYKGGRISMFIAKLLVKIKHISLVNIIAQKEVVPELIQEKCNVKNIRTELKNILFKKEYRKTMLQGYDEIEKTIGKQDASKDAAKLIVQYIR